MRTFHCSRLMLLFTSCTVSILAAGQTADWLIEKNLVARGGAEKLRAIRTILMTGTISFDGASSRLTVKVKRPNRIREDFEVQGRPMVRAYDGKTGWEKEAEKTRSLDGGELNNIREEAENAIEGPLLDYAKKGSKVEYLGKDTVNGRSVYKLKVVTALGTSITQYLDDFSYLEVHEEIARSANSQTVTIVEDVSDYRSVAGVKFAHRFVSGTRENPAASTLQIDKMELNVPIDDSAFRLAK